MENVKDLIAEIQKGIKASNQTSSSKKDEVRVMKAMLNDTDFVVDTYSKEGKTGTYCPSEEARILFSNVIASTTKMKKEEAASYMENYEFKNSDASIMVGLSKEFINTYTDTGRKLPLGARKNSNISLSGKIKEEGYRSYPKKIGENKDGSPIYDKEKVLIPEHKSMKVYSPCPDYLK